MSAARQMCPLACFLMQCPWCRFLRAGMRVRMGIATGMLPHGATPNESFIMENAKGERGEGVVRDGGRDRESGGER